MYWWFFFFFYRKIRRSFVFFFSSRRRHTRCGRDWSSDVCSSDLGSNFAVGLAVTATALTALLIRPVSGGLADRYGYRLVMQVVALTVALGGVLYFLPFGLTGLIAVRLLLGIGEASLFTAGAVWTVSIAPHSRRGQLIGLYGVSMWGGISLGTFLGATLQLCGYSAVYAGTRLFIGHLPDQLGPRRVAAWSGIGEAVGLLIIAMAPNLPVAVLGGLVMGVGFSLLHPSLALMVMNLTDKSKQGAAIGAYTSFWDLGLGVWGPVTGVVATTFGYPAVFIVGAACAASATAVALSVRQPDVQSATAS